MHADRVLGIVGVQDGGETFFLAEPLDQIHDDQLVPEIKPGFRLVKNQHLRLCGEGTGNQHQLKLAAAQLSAVSVREAGDAGPLHGPLRRLPVLFPGDAEQRQIGAPPEKHHVKTGAGEGENLCLGHISNLLPEFRGGNPAEILPVQKRGAFCPGEEAQHAAEQRRFPGAVRPQNRDGASRPGLEADIFQYLVFSRIAEASVFYFK